MPSSISLASLWSNIGSFLSNLFYTGKTFFNSVLIINNLIDVIVITLIIYYAMRLVRETRALQLLKSIGVILALYFVANAFSMITLKFLLGMILNSGFVVLVVLFQPELRRALEQIGRSKLSDFRNLGKLGAAPTEQEQAEQMIETVCEACGNLSKTKTGALIVIEREIKLGDIVGTGTVIDSLPSEELLGNLFFSNSPLHDGALVVRENRLYAAGCFLPLSDNHTISRELGTRHRAALGMSEVSDAIVIVVSEETGAISAALDSRLQRGLSVKNLKMLLGAKLLRSTEEKKRRYFGRTKEKERDQ